MIVRRFRAALLAALAFVILVSACAAQAQPPLDIAADNMSGSHGPEGDIVVLTGNVRITRGRTVLTAAQGRYLRAAGMLFLDRNVKLVDSSTTITCDHASYSEEKDVVELSGNVHLEDADATLNAPAATYHRRVGRAELYGGVTGSDADRTVSADRAYYLRDRRLLQARGRVVAGDEKNKLELRASEVDFDRITHEAVATGAPELEAEDEKGKKAVIRARVLKLNTETRLAEAVDSVLVLRDTMQARADYGLFDDVRQRGWLLGHPRAWNDETVVSGDTLELWTHERTLDRLVVRTNAVVDYVGMGPGRQGETSRLTGDRIDVHFAEEEIDSVVAVGDAADEYRAVAERGKTPESNLSRGDTITVFFVKGKIDRARVVGSARGEYHLAADVGDTASAAREVIRYDAKRIDYIVSRDRIVLDGAAHLVYRDLELNARKVEYDVEKQTLLAEGNPELLDRGDKVTGNLMTYDLESRVGNIYRAQTTFERGLYHGSRIRKVNDNELHVMGGSYTTCDQQNPHYHFAAKWMKIYLKDKLVAKPVVFYVKNVPLLALPFWIFPIKSGRHSGFLFPQFELGFSNRAGRFLRNLGYYWAPNDYMDLTLAGDYYQFEPSWLVEAEGNYKLRLLNLDGHFRTTFARNENPFQKTENWDLNAEHQQDLTPRTRVAARASFVSSKDYNSSNLYGRSLYQRLNRFLVSNLSFTHNADWASFSAAVDRRQDLDAETSLLDPDGQGPERGAPPGSVAPLPTVTENFPTVSIGFPTRTIGSIGFLKGTPLEKTLSTLYFDFDTRFVSTRERRAYVAGYVAFPRDSVTLDSTTVLGERSITRRGFASNVSLSDSRRVMGWLNVQPSLLLNAAVFDFDERGNKVVPVATWSSALSTNATFYGTFAPGIGRLEGIRHVVTPAASFAYSPEFSGLIFVDENGVRRERFNSFGGIGVSGFEQLAMSYSLAQRLQVKLRKGDQVQRLDNLATLVTSGRYDFLWRERGLRHPMSPLSSSLTIQPPGIASASASWLTDPYNRRPLQSLGYNVGFNVSSGRGDEPQDIDLPIDPTRPYSEDSEFNFRERWALDLAYSYSGGYARPMLWSSSQTANVVFRLQLTPAWGFDYSASYDVTNREIGIQRFQLVRDLHCWQASFTRTFAPGGEAEYYFRLQVKDQREIYIERGTRGGSLGGIN